MDYKKFDAIIVGAGISGCVMAERLAKYGKKVLILEKRNHIGGNCFDYFTKEGILVAKYGPHIFRTNDKEVWSYIKQFGEWQKYEHKVVAQIGEKQVPVPINIKTINILFGLNLKTEKEAINFLESKKKKFKKIDNAEKQVLSVVGKELYNWIFRGYTKKQWGKEPAKLDASITARIPVRFNFDDRYYSDKFQFQPVLGFGEMFKKMMRNKLIEIKLKTDFFDVEEKIPKETKIIFSGQADEYYRYITDKKTKLEYRSLKFKDKLVKQEYFQNRAVINFPEEKIPYTRITEHKCISQQKHKWTVVTYEYPQTKGEPYYPMMDKKNIEKYNKIEQRLGKLKNVIFVGRLGKFKYINMDMAVRQVLDTFKEMKDRKWFD